MRMKTASKLFNAEFVALNVLEQKKSKDSSTEYKIYDICIKLKNEIVRTFMHLIY